MEMAEEEDAQLSGGATKQRSTKMVWFSNKYDLFFFSFTPQKKGAGATGWGDGLEKCATVGSVQEFWRLRHMLADTFVGGLSIFQQGVRPMWEDKNVENGGRFILSQTAATMRLSFWSDLCLAMMGECIKDVFDAGNDEMLGVTLSITKKGWKLEIWNRKAGPHVRGVDRRIRELLDVKDKGLFPIEYKSFDGKMDLSWKTYE